jgi:hypothetical protein
MSKWKVIILDSADLMTEEAANSFLKTLEEPHDRILFILTTTRESRILKTIASRCQKVMFWDFRQNPDEEADGIAQRLLKIQEMGMQELLSFSDELSGMPEMEDTLNRVLHSYRGKADATSRASFLAISRIFDALRSLERRGNRRLTLDNMLLSLKEAANN